MPAVRVRVKFNIDRLRRKADRAKRELLAAAKVELEALAHEAVKLVREAPDRREIVAKQIARSLDSVFIPVELKHKRPETWPNLRPIYNARILQGRRSYDGRKLFWVDVNKRDRLADDLEAIALAKSSADAYEVRFVATSDRRFRVEIIKKGRGRIPPAVVAFAKQRAKIAAQNTAARALSRAGLMNGRSATRYSHRNY